MDPILLEIPVRPHNSYTLDFSSDITSNLLHRRRVSCPLQMKIIDAYDNLRRPVAFLDELATNATERGVKVVVYVGNDDSVVPHVSSESELTMTLTSLPYLNYFSRQFRYR